MIQDHYSPPQAQQEPPPEIIIPEDIHKKIKSAWIAGTISISLTALLTVLSLTVTDILGLDFYAFIDIILMIIFTFGIYKKSRTCAILMFLLFSANKVITWIDSGSLQGIFLSVVFFVLYFRGIIGTFQYHRFIKASTHSLPSSPTS